jgi:hypothetical protein
VVTIAVSAALLRSVVRFSLRAPRRWRRAGVATIETLAAGTVVRGEWLDAPAS